jgi:hypothetical protein
MSIGVQVCTPNYKVSCTEIEFARDPGRRIAGDFASAAETRVKTKGPVARWHSRSDVIRRPVEFALAIKAKSQETSPIRLGRDNRISARR